MTPRVSFLSVANSSGGSIQRALGFNAVERKCRHIDIEMFAGRADHAVSTGHETRWRLQWHTAGVFKRLAGLQHRLLTDHAGATHFLQPAVGVGDAPMPGLELHSFITAVGDRNGVGPEKII